MAIPGVYPLARFIRMVLGHTSENPFGFIGLNSSSGSSGLKSLNSWVANM